MFKKLLLGLLAFITSVGIAWAVDANTASQEELETIKGIGPALSTRIIEERKRGGAYKDLGDLETRVKGIGEGNIKSMAAAGLTVGGGRISRPRSDTGVKDAPKADTGVKDAPKAPKAADEKPTAKKDEPKAEKTAKKDEPKAKDDKPAAKKDDAKKAEDKAKK